MQEEFCSIGWLSTNPPETHSIYISWLNQNIHVLLTFQYKYWESRVRILKNG